MPNENKSVRASSCLPSTCSGDMYDTVPKVDPGLVRCSLTDIVFAEAMRLAEGCCASTFANPKSRIFACPRFVTKMFAGLMSR